MLTGMGNITTHISQMGKQRCSIHEPKVYVDPPGMFAKNGVTHLINHLEKEPMAKSYSIWHSDARARVSCCRCHEKHSLQPSHP